MAGKTAAVVKELAKFLINPVVHKNLGTYVPLAQTLFSWYNGPPQANWTIQQIEARLSLQESESIEQRRRSGIQEQKNIEEQGRMEDELKQQRLVLSDVIEQKDSELILLHAVVDQFVIERDIRERQTEDQAEQKRVEMERMLAELAIRNAQNEERITLAPNEELQRAEVQRTPVAGQVQRTRRTEDERLRVIAATAVEQETRIEIEKRRAEAARQTEETKRADEERRSNEEAIGQRTTENQNHGILTQIPRDTTEDETERELNDTTCGEEEPTREGIMDEIHPKYTSPINKYDTQVILSTGPATRALFSTVGAGSKVLSKDACPVAQTQYELALAQKAIAIIALAISRASAVPPPAEMIRDIRVGVMETQLLLLSKTRELAFHVQSVLKSVAEPMKLRSVVCAGGRTEPREWQHIVSGTPVRVANLIKKGKLWMAHIRVLVLNMEDVPENLYQEIYDVYRHLPAGTKILRGVVRAGSQG